MKNNEDTYRILAQGHMQNNNTWVTGINNNDLIIGPSGAGKTRNYVKPNIMQCNESMIIADTKGSLLGELKGLLEKDGYKVLNIDFTELNNSSCGYNPLAYIREDKRHKNYTKFMDQDIMMIARILSPTRSRQDPFWDNAACMVLACLIGYVMECLPEEEHTLEYVAKLLMAGQNNIDMLMEDLELENPQSFAVQKYKLFRTVCGSPVTYSSILGVLSEKLDFATFDGAYTMFNHPEQIYFPDFGKEKTALFLTISDTERSMDKLVNLLYTQALHSLCDSADKDYPDHRLAVPVRFILDDFAANFEIPDFDKIISVIRSREIYVSVILQSISQLRALYGEARAETIINNCDNCLYLGGQDTTTARFIAEKVNKTPNTILNLPLDSAYLFTRGCEAKQVKKYDIKEHERYNELSEAR